MKRTLDTYIPIIAISVGPVIPTRAAVIVGMVVIVMI